LDAALLAPQPERGPQDRPQHPVPVAERFGTDLPATSDLDPAAMERRAEQGALIKGTYVKAREA